MLAMEEGSRSVANTVMANTVTRVLPCSVKSKTTHSRLRLDGTRKTFVKQMSG